MIIKQEDLHSKSGWIKEITSQILSRFGRKPEKVFPCNFARKAFGSDMVRFLPVPYDKELGDYDYTVLGNGLHEFLEDAKEWDGRFNTAFPLLVIFEPNTDIKNLERCEEVFLKSIQYLVNNDPCPWPSDTPLDPENKFWSMCFNQTQIFINTSHPNHTFRDSRNLCDTLVLVINPRERFDKFAGDNEAGRMMRKAIRDNIDKYDKIPHSPLLGHYFAGELEWPQYMLPITNDLKGMECPFSFGSKSIDARHE